MTQFCISNVSALIQIDTHGSLLDLQQLSDRISNSSFNQKRFAALIIRKSRPKSSYLLFRTGKMILLGVKSVQEAQMCAVKMTKDLNRILNYKPTPIKSFKITNIFGTGHFGRKVDLGRLAQEPEAFMDDCMNCLIFRLDLKQGNSPKTALIYPSGKFTLMGGKSEEAVQKCKQILESRVSVYLRVEEKEQACNEDTVQN